MNIKSQTKKLLNKYFTNSNTNNYGLTISGGAKCSGRDILKYVQGKFLKLYYNKVTHISVKIIVLKWIRPHGCIW